MTDFLPALPHGPLVEVFPNVFQVTGNFRAGPGMTFGRNMTIVRQGDELSVINSVRLTPEGEASLEKLGKVKHLLRIGQFHGADDPYYMDRYKPTLWAPPRMRHAAGLTTGRELRPGESPIDDSEVFNFDGGKLSEGVILLRREGGILVTCDSFQNWTTFEGASFVARIALRLMRFGPAMIGPIWAKNMGPGVQGDFDRLVALDWRHALAGHGEPLRDTGREALRGAIAKYYGARA